MSKQHGNDAFETAYQRFLSTLSARDRLRFAECASPHELLEGFKKIEGISKQQPKHKLNRCMSAISKLNDRLCPYFDVLNVMAGSNPYAAIAYGAFRLILQFDAIAEVYRDALPPRMREYLENIYTTLLDFFRIVAEIFTASNGKIKRPVALIGTVVWKPFHATFRDIVSRMDFYRGLIRDELLILQAQAAQNSEEAATREQKLTEYTLRAAEDAKLMAQQLCDQTEEIKSKLDRERRENTLQQIRSWLAPPNFADVLHKAQDLREEGTASWVFGNEEFRKWNDTPTGFAGAASSRKLPPCVLWIHVEELLENQRQPNTYYFFFQYNSKDCSAPDGAYRSILAQILNQHREDNNLIQKFSFALFDSDASGGQARASIKEVLELLRMLASYLKGVDLILDGIDECVAPELLINHLTNLMSTAPVKLLCLGRQNVDILNRKVPASQQIAFDKSATGSDIRMYLTNQLNLLVEEDMLPSAADVRILVDHLVHGANGMFLWARLMVQYLYSPALTPSARIRTINSVILPEGLQGMYNRILSLILSSMDIEKELARRVLIWLAHSSSQLQEQFLQQAVTFDHDEIADFVDFKGTVSIICGGLVEYDPSVKCFQFIHLSVRDYILDADHLIARGYASHIPPSLRNDLSSLSSTLNRLGEDIRVLHHEWGQKLTSNPQLIWDDVLVFQNSSFLPRVRSRRAVLAQDPPAGTLEGSRSLCSISSTSFTGKTRAQLSIWPSDSFVKQWNELEPVTAYHRVEQYSHAWVARYNIWSTDGGAKCVTDLSIGLPAEEIALLLRQSFRERSFWDDAKDQSMLWKTSFPLSISPDNRVFMILRTVYRVQIESAAHKSSYHSQLLDMGFLKPYDDKWDTRLEIYDPAQQLKGIPEGLHSAFRDWYTYSFTFSESGHYILFFDYHQPCITNLAVFELQRTDDLPVSFCSSFRARYGPLTNVKYVNFHPRFPLVAYLADSMVWLWSFKQETSKPAHIPTRFDNSTAEITALAFSPCGQYLIARTNQSCDALFLSGLEALDRKTKLLLSTHDTNTSAEEKSALTRQRLSSQEPLSQSLLNLGQGGSLSLIRSTQVLPLTAAAAPDATKVKTLVPTSTSNNDLQLTMLEQGFSRPTRGLHLCSLPNSVDMTNVSISISIPIKRPETETEDAELSIFLDKNPKRAYSLSEQRPSASFQVPMVIHRPVSSVYALEDCNSAIPRRKHAGIEKRGSIKEDVPSGRGSGGQPLKRPRLDI
ncbi:hypothetical protein BBP40_002282 [Aspergillus hancockii]|nr:hypothetical protein BBP40_002282 [Aspergillus hancockii]